MIIQFVVNSKEDYPKPGEWLRHNGKLHKVIKSRLDRKLHKLYWVNVEVESEGLTDR